jgi:hypothetical protein
MQEVARMLSTWNSFYVMTGSAAAGLTGLMFVVITLIRDTSRPTTEDGVSTFSTPTVFHFSGALFTSALMCVPFRSFVPIAIILALEGATGMFHVARVAHWTSKLQSYRPDLEDWTWNVLLPFVAYAAIVAGAIALNTAPARALYAPAAAVMLLIFVGIHNAWDVVTFLAAGKADALPDRPVNAGETQKTD